MEAKEGEGGKKTDNILGCQTCDVFPLNLPTQEKNNRPMGHNTQIE